MVTRLPGRLLLGALLLLGPLGCTAWYRDTTLLTAPLPERKAVQIFTPTGTIVAHSVRADTTSLSYVSRYKPSDCDSCRVTIPLVTVDSFRTSRISATRTVILLTSLLGLYTILVLNTPPTI
jgi:hypothetical protein